MQPSANAISEQPRRRSRLRAAAVALLLLLITAAIADGLMGRYAVQYLDRLAPTGEDEVVKGLYLTRLAVAQPDRLPLLGSSELTFQDEYHPARLFANKPTGFNTWVIGSGYRQSVHNFLLLSALGPQVKGKKVVLFLSPTWFTRRIEERAYKKNYSQVQAYQFVYGSALSPELKRDAAQQLLNLGSPATDDPLLRNGLAGLARGGLRGATQYYLSWPLGRFTLLHLHLKDRLALVRLIQRKGLTPAPARHGPSTIDWDRLWERAGAEAQAKTAGNPFGMSDEFYNRHVAPRLAEIEGSARQESWLTSMEYDDLALVLRELKELGAEPLFISLPVLGAYQDFKGHLAADRTDYYARVRRMVEDAGFPLVDLSRYEYEPGFHRDPWHQGWKGTVLIAEVLDRFYHGQPPDPGR